MVKLLIQQEIRQTKMGNSLKSKKKKVYSKALKISVVHDHNQYSPFFFHKIQSLFWNCKCKRKFFVIPTAASVPKVYFKVIPTVSSFLRHLKPKYKSITWATVATTHNTMSCDLVALVCIYRYYSSFGMLVNFLMFKFTTDQWECTKLMLHHCTQITWSFYCIFIGQSWIQMLKKWTSNLKGAVQALQTTTMLSRLFVHFINIWI